MKSYVGDLALFGGEPLFTDPLHVGRPNVGRRRRLFERLNDVLDRRWLTNDGRYVQELEALLASRLGVRHAVAVANGTVGLDIAVRAAGLTGDVIVPSFTFIATSHVLLWQGLSPVFCDVDPVTHNLSPEHVEALVTDRVSGIIGVHLWGRASAVKELNDIARRHGLTLLYDAAHALLSSYQGRMIGGFGRAEVLSFHATKFVNSFEGGAIVTDDHEIAHRARLMRNFGFTDYDEVSALGTNGKMSEASAAMGLTSLESADEFIAINRRNYVAYRRRLVAVPGIHLLPYAETEQHNYQFIVVELDRGRAGLSRDQLQRVLWAENVISRRYFYPGCHRMEPYRSMPRYGQLDLPATDALASRVLCLPTGTTVTVEVVEAICDVIALTVRHGAEIARRLQDDHTGRAALPDDLTRQ
jgi:dTDP-4-amino-4,6-dideoxygalactose transaminase